MKPYSFGFQRFNSARSASIPAASIFAQVAGVSRMVRCTRCSSGGFGGLPRGRFGSSMSRTVAPIYEDSNNPCNADFSDYNKSSSTEVNMLAGEVFMQPEEGALRLVISKVYGALDDVGRTGYVVQECAPKTDEDGFELVSCEWVTVCPLTDAHFTLPFGAAPACWHEASRDLRALIEAGQPVGLDVERAALLKHSPRASRPTRGRRMAERAHGVVAVAPPLPPGMEHAPSCAIFHHADDLAECTCGVEGRTK